MPYRVPESDLAQYYRDGYIVFRRVLPVSLVRDLRRECDKAIEIARRLHGPQAQRLQPVARHEGELDMKPFRDYAQLPELREAIDQVLSPRHAWGKVDIMGVLIHPRDTPWCTAWHRDMTLETSRLPAEQFHDLMLDWNSANQINCPLYDDDCAWFVPGSHLRARDFPGETAARDAAPPKDAADPVEQERRCAAYAAGMPGAARLLLRAGDFALYRPIGWHIGNYVPYKKRATLHDGLFTPRYEAWWREWIKGGSPEWIRKV